MRNNPRISFMNPKLHLLLCISIVLTLITGCQSAGERAANARQKRSEQIKTYEENYIKENKIIIEPYSLKDTYDSANSTYEEILKLLLWEKEYQNDIDTLFSGSESNTKLWDYMNQLNLTSEESEEVDSYFDDVVDTTYKSVETKKNKYLKSILEKSTSLSQDKKDEIYDAYDYTGDRFCYGDASFLLSMYEGYENQNPYTVFSYVIISYADDSENCDSYEANIPTETMSILYPDDMEKAAVSIIEETNHSSDDYQEAVLYLKYIKKNDTYEDEFVNIDGSRSKVKMMSSDEKEYLENDFFTGFIKPYEGDYSFIALLPKKQKNKSFIIRALNNLDISDLYQNRKYLKTIVKIPEFEMSFKENITSLCQQMGIKQAFSMQADFSTLSSEQLTIENMIHEAKIEVNRKGTKAAAASMAAVFGGCAPDFNRIKYVYLDRPFVYAIVDNKTTLPIFVGEINKIS